MEPHAEATSRAAALGFTACVVGMKPGLDRITASSATFPKATYLSKLESTCIDAILQLAKIDVSSGRAAWGDELAQQVSILEKAVAAMKVNPAPPADAAVVAAINSAAEKAVAKIRERRDAVLADDAARARPLAASATALSRQANAKLAAYGPKLCSELFPS